MHWLLRVKHKALLFLCMVVIVLNITVACNDSSNSISSSSINFPVQIAGLGQMDALLEGKLVLDNGYLRVKNLNDSYLLIWPNGFSISIEGDETQVIDSKGHVVAHAGDEITVGGGEISGERAREIIGDLIDNHSLPDDSTGPYWIVANVIK